MSVYTDTIRERVLTPEVVEGVQRAAMLLRVARDDVKAAMDILVPVVQAMSDAGGDVLDAGHDISSADEHAVRAGAYTGAVDLVFEILNEAGRIERGDG